MQIIAKHALLINLLEDILETPIVTLQNGIFRAQIEWPLLHQSILEAGVRKASNALKIKTT